MLPISVTILTKNSQRHLQEVLEALTLFDEVLLLDNGSTDKSIEIAKQFPNVVVHYHEFIGFGKMHQLAVSLAKHDWIFSIDSDEIPSKELLSEIAALVLDPSYGYAILRDNYYNGKKIAHLWGNDYVVRLFCRTHYHFSDQEIHEKVLLPKEKERKLHGVIRHYPYASIADLLAKMQSYSTLFVKEKAHKPASFGRALFHAFFTLLKSLFLKRAFLDGKEGWILSFYNAHTAWYKYLKLLEQKTTR